MLWHGDQLQPGELDEHRMRGLATRQAQQEHDLGLSSPSLMFRRRFGFPLGLSRLTCSDPIKLLDGTQLAEHQVEVLEAILDTLTRRLEDPLRAPVSDPNRHRRLWFEHATGSGKTVVAAALVDAARSGRVLILTHRNNLVEQFRNELTERGYGSRLRDIDDPQLSRSYGGVVVTTYQYFARSWTEFDPDLFTLVICDEVHTTLGEKTSRAIRGFSDLPVIGMTATGQLLDKQVTDLFPHRVSSFDLVQAARSGVIAPLRALRIPPAVGMQTLEGTRQRTGDFDPEALEQLLNRDPFNYACARMYRELFKDRSGVIYAAGVRHAEQLAVAFLASGIPSAAVSGQTPKPELQRILDEYEAGRLQVIINAQLLTEGWNSPRAEVCLHLAPTASRRIYQQRIGRVTRRSEGKNAGIVVDFVDPGYVNGGKVVTLHSLLDLDMYAAGQPVTHGPSGPVPEPEPPISWKPQAVVPIAAVAHRREKAIRNHADKISFDQLRSEDQQLYVTSLARSAQTVSQLRKLQQRPAELLPQAYREAILHNRSRECQNLAADWLLNLAAKQAEAWQALVEAATQTSDATLSRRLGQRALEMAARGAADQLPQGHHLLVQLAGLDQPLYQRVADRSRSLRQLGHQSSCTQKAMHAMIMEAPEAAALLVTLNPVSDIEQDRVRHAIHQLFPAPTDLASALSRARRMV